MERQHLSRALTALERQHRRSADYLEVQRRTHGILKSMDGLHYTGYLQHEGLRQLESDMFGRSRPQQQEPQQTAVHHTDIRQQQVENTDE